MIYLSVEYFDSIQIVKEYHHHYEFKFFDLLSKIVHLWRFFFFPKIDDITNYEEFRMNE